MKTPKLHLCDTDLACTLLGVNASALWDDRALYGKVLETFVYKELRRHASLQDEPISFHHYRDKDGSETDVVVESNGQIAGIEIKAASTVTAADFKAMHKIKSATGKRFVRAVVRYDGNAVASFGEGLLAVPISVLWDMQ